MEPTPAVKVTAHDLSPEQTADLEKIGQALVNLRLQIADARDKIRQLEEDMGKVRAHAEGALATLKTTYKLEGNWEPSPDFKQLVLQG